MYKEKCSRRWKEALSVLIAAVLLVLNGINIYAANSGSSTAVLMDGKVSSNYSNNNYSVSASVVNSYLTENEDGTLTRVEYLGDGSITSVSYTLPLEICGTRLIMCG